MKKLILGSGIVTAFSILVDPSDPLKISSIYINSISHPYLSKRLASGFYFGDKIKALIKPNLNNYYFSIVDGIINILSNLIYI